MIKEFNDTPYYYGKRLKALIICGYDTEKKKNVYYKVLCYEKRHEVRETKQFDIPINDITLETYQSACKYAQNYTNTCKY